MGEEIKTTEGTISFEEKVRDIAGGLFENGWVDSMVEESLKNAIKNAVDAEFSYNGAAYNAIKKIVNESVTKSLGGLSAGYIPKLETVLQGIIDQTVIGDQKRLLNNFMYFIDDSKIPQPEKGKWYSVITLEEIFKEYCSYVARNIDTDGREIDYDDGPTYKYVECMAWIEPEDVLTYSRHKHATLFLAISEDESKENQEKLNLSVPLLMWGDDTERGWYLYGQPGQVDYGNLARMDEMLCYLTRLRCNGVYIADTTKSLEDYIPPEEKPEPEWH